MESYSCILARVWRDRTRVSASEVRCLGVRSGDDAMHVDCNLWISLREEDNAAAAWGLSAIFVFAFVFVSLS